MSYVLSVIKPPENGAAFGKAEVHPPMQALQSAAVVVTLTLVTFANVEDREAEKFGLSLLTKRTSADIRHDASGIIFRIDPEGRAPNACPCCGRLVTWGDHALAGSDDAYCLGCFTWKRGMVPCSPHESAHANPWTMTPRGATHMMQIVFGSRRSETDTDVRYTADKSHEMWDDVDNALIAWPGLSRDQIIEVTIKEINR